MGQAVALVEEYVTLLPGCGDLVFGSDWRLTLIELASLAVGPVERRGDLEWMATPPWAQAVARQNWASSLFVSALA